MYLYIHGAKKPGPSLPWQKLAAIKCPILYAVPLAVPAVPYIGSKPQPSSPENTAFSFHQGLLNKCSIT